MQVDVAASLSMTSMIDPFLSKLAGHIWSETSRFKFHRIKSSRIQGPGWWSLILQEPATGANFSQISGFTECPEDDGIFLGDFGCTKCEAWNLDCYSRCALEVVVKNSRLSGKNEPLLPPKDRDFSQDLQVVLQNTSIASIQKFRDFGVPISIRSDFVPIIGFAACMFAPAHYVKVYDSWLNMYIMDICNHLYTFVMIDSVLHDCLSGHIFAFLMASFWHTHTIVFCQLTCIH